MTIIGFGLFAVAIAIVFSALLLHHDVKVVYYPRKIKARVLSPEEMAARRASLGKVLGTNGVADWLELEDRLDLADAMRLDE